MKRYVLCRGGKPIALAVDFGWGESAILQWLGDTKSVAVYPSFDALLKIHQHESTIVHDLDSEWFGRAQMDCVQDQCENAPFGSIGGLLRRHKFKRPDYVPERAEFAYFSGYRFAALMLYGDDWETCEFGWSKAFTL